MTGAALGGHLAHVVVFGAFGFSVLVALAWPTGPAPAADDTGARRAPGPAPRRAPRGALLQGAFLGLCAAAAVHVAVLPTHLRQSALLGSFFAVTAAAQAALAALLLARPSRRLLAGVGAGSVAVILLWATTRMVTLPFGIDGPRPEAVGVLDVLACLAELTTAACAVALLVGQRRRRSAGVALRPAWRWSGWSLPLRIALLAVSIGVPWTALLAPRG